MLLVVLLLNRSSSTPTAATSPSAGPSSPSTTASQRSASASQSLPRASEPVSQVASSSADGSAGAAEIDNLLDRSVGARSGVLPALTRIGNCEGGAADLRTLDDAAATRDDLRRQLSSAGLDGLPDANRLRSELDQVFAVSAAADRGYEAWGQDVEGCTGQASPADSNKRQGDAYSREATSAKKAFLRLWNPLAARYGLSTRQQADI